MSSNQTTQKIPLTRFLILVCIITFSVFTQSAWGFVQKKVIIAYGDSLTAGCWNTEPEKSTCGITPRPGYQSYDYADQLQEQLDSREHNFLVQNFGKGGETTSDALSFRFDATLNNSCNADAQFILILQGTNDLFHRDNKQNIKFNLGVMVDKSLAKGLVPLLATIPPDLTPGHEYKGISEMNLYIRQLVEEKVAQGKNVILVDLYKGLLPFWNNYTNPRSCYALFNPDDQLHPNADGTRAMGTEWYVSLKQHLPPKIMHWLMLLLDDTKVP